MKEGLGSHASGLLRESDTLLGENGVERRQGVEGPIRERFVGQRPHPLRRLEFGGIGGQQFQVNATRDGHLGAAVPAGLIHHEHYLLGGPCPDLLGEMGQGAGEGRDIDRRHEQPVRRPRLGLHKPIDVLPLVAGPDAGAERLAPPRPDPPEDRLQPDAMLVGGPQFDGGVGAGALECCDAGREALGKAA
jgi:hypothetical protein